MQKQIDPELSLLLVPEAERVAPGKLDEDLLAGPIIDSVLREVLPVLPRGIGAFDFNKYDLRLNSASFSPDNNYVVTGSEDKMARVWKVEGKTWVLAGNKWQIVQTLTGHEARINSAVFSSDGKLIVTATADGTARVYPEMMFRPLAELKKRGGAA